MDSTYGYIKVNGGIDSEESYPYVGTNSDCAFDPSGVAATVSSFVNINSASESTLMTKVALVGPVCAFVDNSQSTFTFYSEDIVRPSDLCITSTCRDSCLLVYFVKSPYGQKYWIVRNSVFWLVETRGSAGVNVTSLDAEWSAFKLKYATRGSRTYNYSWKTHCFITEQLPQMEKHSTTNAQHVSFARQHRLEKERSSDSCEDAGAVPSYTGALESQHFIRTGQLVELSEQNLIDCSQDFGNLGCEGGRADQAFEYIIQNKGVDLEELYPYAFKTMPCAFDKGAVGATMSSFHTVPQMSEEQLQIAVATVGPVAVVIDAEHDDFFQYDQGIYDNPFCRASEVNYGLLVVGYGTTNGIDYWICKNSMGPDWGERGYIRMARNKQNQCGIATSATYPEI
ncbi:hypothetical protein HPB51_023277 [Rhipicephalus microplus]|uniref:Peptidase C1A papain C-terminal domain-containing protein n=1 Tax=Rhipicephalus microplus TaxID=6941 RepID=A0A9J6DJH6_RHIMP|nr:hypothetical protein HPB51_023277 [Rhipicephalus microplus]